MDLISCSHTLSRTQWVSKMTDWCVAHLSTGAVVLQKSGWYGMAERVTCFGGHVLFNQQGKINNLENDNNIIMRKCSWKYLLVWLEWLDHTNDTNYQSPPHKAYLKPWRPLQRQYCKGDNDDSNWQTMYYAALVEWPITVLWMYYELSYEEKSHFLFVNLHSSVFFWKYITEYIAFTWATVS